MAVVPTRHLCPRSNTFIDSFNTSVSKFSHTTRLRLLMYSYHGLPLKLSFCAANGSTTNSASTIQQIPQNRLNLYRETRCKPMGLADESFISNGQASDLSFLRTSVSIYQQNPPKRSNFYRGTKSKAMGLSGESDVSKGHACSLNSLRNSWLDKWSETQKNKLKAPQSVVDYRNNGEDSDSDSDHQESSSTGITMERIVQKLNRFQNVENSGEKEGNADKVFEKGSIEDIFHIDEGILPDSSGGFSEKRPFGDGNMLSINGEVRFPWQKPELNAEEERYSARKKIRTSLAELTLPETELYRLTKLTFKIKNKLKISGAGVSQDIVEKIHDRWKESEVVRLKIEAAPSLNMKRMHEVLEKKTGGLVIWRSGTSVGLYRGVGYKLQSEIPPRRTYNKDDIPHRFSITTTTDTNVNDELETQVRPGIDDSNEVTDIESNPEMKFEEEIEKLLVGLGPRYIDWPGPDPLPIDADLLPGVLPGYEPPFRILPYGVRSSLGSKEATDLKRLARVIPPHFALGRSRQHQGLASAMIKLWEKSSIAKIALKRGVQLSTSEKMAEEIKKLTGCIMLSRNKDFLVFYRGKDFLSTEVAEALLEKGRLAKSLQDEEEQARLRTSAFVAKGVLYSDESRTAGTLGETLDAGARWGNKLDKEKVTRDAKILRHGNLVKMLEKKLATVERKILKAERALSKVEQSLNPAKSVSNPDCITEEERFMFRKLGLRMKAFLLLGRRGVFSGTIENMHLHWKYRELVKIIVKAKNFDQVKRIALSLEAESGGVLVSVDKISKGYAIIVYRGNEYTRPSALRPRNLLTKRQALARSIELQRHEALMKHISTLQARYDRMRFELEQMAKVEDHGDEELYNKIDSNYHTEDEESEEEEDDAYPEVDGINDDFLDQIEEEEVNSISLSL